MFWGLLLEPGKRYSTTVEKSFHVSKAALDCASVKNDHEILSVILETEGSEALLCNLCKQKGILQENLDLNFMAGDRLTFECRGQGRIHLTGYLLPDDEDDISGMMGDEESEEEEEESASWSQTPSPEKSKKEKRKIEAPPNVPQKKKKGATDSDEDEGESDSDQDDESDLSEGDLNLDGLEEEGENEDESDEDDESEDEDEDEEEEINLSKKDKKKQQKQHDKSKIPNKQNLNTSSKTPVTNGLAPKEQKSNKKSPTGNKMPNPTPKQKQLLDQGVMVREISVGGGAPAKPGKTVSVYYVGKLKENGKVFDKVFKGEGFKFKLGKGEVIKGWDIGVQGMKVGGKRVIHCPSDVAYGSKGVPPKIPPNSSLIFEVELKSVN